CMGGRFAKAFTGAGARIRAGLVAARRADHHSDASAAVKIGVIGPRHGITVNFHVLVSCPGHPPDDRIFWSDGRSPGSRIVALGCLPGKSQWLLAFGSSLTLAGTAADLKHCVSY